MNTKDIQCTSDWRYLGLTESLFSDCSQYKEPIGLHYLADIISSSQKIPDEIVKKAMFILSLQHVLLHSKISKDKNGDLLFQHLSCDQTSTADWLPIKFSSIENKGDWVQQIPSMTKLGFPFDEPLWRMLWCTVSGKEQSETENVEVDQKFTYVLILCIHHSISDAKSNFDLICNQFLPILNRLLMKEDLFALPKPVKLAKSFESIFLDTHIPISKISHNSRDKKIENVSPNHKPYNQTTKSLGSNESYHENEREHIHPFIISEELTEAVIKFAKTVKLSVTSVISSFMMVAIKEAEKKRGKEFDGVEMNVVLDFRKFNSMLNTSPMPLGMYVPLSVIEDFITAPENEELNNILKTAATIQELINNKNKMSAVTKESHFMPLSLLLSESFGILDKMVVSSIGVFERQNWDFTDIADVEEHYFLADQSLSNILFMVHTFKGKMTFCLVGNYHWLDINYLKDLAHSFVGVLERIVQQCHT